MAPSASPPRHPIQVASSMELRIDALVLADGLPNHPRCQTLDDGPTPGEPKPSSNSLQPTTPSSVLSLTKW